MARRKQEAIVTLGERADCPAPCCRGLVMASDRPHNLSEFEELK